MQEAKMVLFADDTNILVIDKDEDALQQKIYKVMKQLRIWFQENGLLINTEKNNCNLISL
jgi:hypothetical protein